MKILQFTITEWLFWFTSKHEIKIKNLYKAHEEDSKTWFIFSILLPFLTYLFSIVANLMIIPFCELGEKWSSILNNGSLPIIAFGVISAGIPYLMEKIENRNIQGREIENKQIVDDSRVEFDEFHTIRKRVMAVATLFLFLTSGLFIFQSISPNISKTTSFFSSFLSFALSIIFAWFSASIGVKMYLLQGSFIGGDFSNSMKESRNNLTQPVNDGFTN